MQGKIFTIEGLDGVGKSTQIRLLVQKLEALGIAYQYIHFPMLDKGSYGKLIAEYLRGEFGNIKSVHPKLVALLFAEDRNEHKKQMLSWLDQGYYLILDRYVYSNIAYQCAKTEGTEEKRKLKEWILDFEFNHNQLPKPELNFFLNVPFENIERNLSKNRKGDDRDYLKGKQDVHEASIHFQKSVFQEYKALIAEQDDLLEIDCCSTQGEWLHSSIIHDKIFQKIEPLLK